MKKLVIMLSSATAILAVAGGLAWILRSKPTDGATSSGPFAKTSKDSACMAAVSAIVSEEDDCDKKLSLYNAHVEACADQYVMIEDPEPYETVFSDEIFEVFRCYQAHDQPVKAKAALDRALAIKEWSMNGPANCSGHMTARAELDALTRHAQTTCFKPAALETEIKKSLVSLKPEALEPLLGPGTVLSAGSYESDDVCPITFEEMGAALKRVLPTAPKNLQVLRREPSEGGDRFLIGAAGSDAKDPWLVLDFVPSNGCEQLSQVLVGQQAE